MSYFEAVKSILSLSYLKEVLYTKGLKDLAFKILGIFKALGYIFAGLIVFVSFPISALFLKMAAEIHYKKMEEVKEKKIKRYLFIANIIKRSRTK